LHSDDEYQKAIEDLLDILSTLKARAASMTSSAAEKAKTHAKALTEEEEERSAQQQHLSIAVKNAKSLVEHFANNRSLDPLYNELMELLRDMRQDRELDDLSSDMKRYILRALRDASFVDDAQFADQGRQLMDRTRDVVTSRYNQVVERIGSESQEFLQGFREDKMTMKLGQGVRELVNDMFIDSESGKPTLKMSLAKDVARLIPVIAQKVKFIPIPRIEDSDDHYEYAIDNLVVSATNIIPEHVRITTQTDLKKVPESSGKFDVNNLLAFTIQNVHAVAHRVAFYYKKKSGIARMADAGYADITIQGRGLDVGVILAAGNPHSDHRSFQVLRVDTLIHNISLTMSETKRDFFYKMFSPIVKSIVRKRLEEGIATGVMEFMVAFDKQITRSTKQSAGYVSRTAQKTGEHVKTLQERRAEGKKDQSGRYNDPEEAQSIPSHKLEEQEAHTVQQQKILEEQQREQQLRQKQQRDRNDTGGAMQQQPAANTFDDPSVRKGPQQAM